MDTMRSTIVIEAKEPVIPPGWQGSKPLMQLLTIQAYVDKMPVRLADAWRPRPGKIEAQLTLYKPGHGGSYWVAGPVNTETDPSWMAGIRCRPGALLTPSELESVGYTREWLAENDRFRSFGFGSPEVWWTQDGGNRPERRRDKVVVIRSPVTATPVYCHGIDGDPEKVNRCRRVFFGDRAFGGAFIPGGQLELEEAGLELDLKVLEGLSIIPSELEDQVGEAMGMGSHVAALHAAALAQGIVIVGARPTASYNPDEGEAGGEVPSAISDEIDRLTGRTKPKPATPPPAPSAPPVSVKPKPDGTPLDKLKVSSAHRAALEEAGLDTVEKLASSSFKTPPSLHRIITGGDYRKARKAAKDWIENPPAPEPEPEEPKPIKPGKKPRTRRPQPAAPVIEDDGEDDGTIPDISFEADGGKTVALGKRVQNSMGPALKAALKDKAAETVAK